MAPVASRTRNRLKAARKNLPGAAAAAAAAGDVVLGAMATDRISDLPDAVLCHILSLLPAKQSVGTSVLSRRWRPLWTCVPVLELYRKSHATDSSFVSFVTLVLSSRGAPIERLSIWCGDNDLGDCGQACVDAWASAAICNKVEELTFYLPGNLSFPRCLLSCTTLVALTINALWDDDSISGAVHLPSLKYLLIHARSFACSHIINFLSGCPVLMELHLLGFDLSWDSVPECLRRRLLINLPRLREATIVFTNELNEGNDTEYWKYYLFNKLCNAVDLILSSTIMQSLVNASIKEIPTFNKLAHLQLMIEGAFSWTSMTRLLQNCHQLEVLRIRKLTRDIVIEEPSYWTHPHPVPTCVSLRLRYVCFVQYDGSQSELQVVRYFLKNAKSLETMEISSAPTLNAEAKLKILRDLSAFRRCSDRCQLLFV